MVCGQQPKRKREVAVSLWTSIQRLFGKKRKPKRDFPPWCKALCYGALNEARAAIESKGTRLKEHSITVRVRTDTQLREGGWGWFVPVLDLWAGALTSPDGGLVEIAIDPAQVGNPNALHVGSLMHDIGHHWLITNNHGGGHDALYDDVLPGWKEARAFWGKGRG